MATAVETPNGVDFGTPEYTTITRDVAYGIKTLDEKDAKTGANKTEYVVLDRQEAEKLDAEGKFSGNIVTVVYDLPVNWAAIRAFENMSYVDQNGEPREIKEGLKDLVTLFRPGIQAKLQNRVRQALLDTDDNGNLTFDDKQLTDGKFNVTAEIISPSKRVVLTEEQKTWKSLATLPAEIRKQMWAVYLKNINKEYYEPEVSE